MLHVNKFTALFILVIFIFLNGCSKTIYEGDFKGLRIGQNKVETLKALSDFSKVKSVFPSLPIYIELDSIEAVDHSKLEMLISQKAIQIHPELVGFINVYLDDDQIIEIEEYSKATSADYGIQVGMTTSQFQISITQLLSSRQILKVNSFLRDKKGIVLASLSDEGLATLMRYDSWKAYYEREYGYLILDFNEGYLSKIVHKWSPIEFK